MALVAAALPVSPIEAQHSGIFQYSRNLEPHQYQFGYTRGDGSHRIARRQQADGSHFETKVATQFQFHWLRCQLTIQNSNQCCAGEMGR